MGEDGRASLGTGFGRGSQPGGAALAHTKREAEPAVQGCHFAAYCHGHYGHVSLPDHKHK